MHRYLSFVHVRPHRSLLLVLVLVWLPLLLTACLGRLEHDGVAEAITRSPREKLGLPVRESRRYWLLRAEDGWFSSHETRFGGNPGDDGVVTVRIARFQDDESAGRGFVRLTPDYLHLAFRDVMVGKPHALEYPLPIPGDQVSTFAYTLRLPPDTPAEVLLYGQLTAVRAGATVFLIESIGVHPDRLVPTIDELVITARQLEGVR